MGSNSDDSVKYFLGWRFAGNNTTPPTLPGMANQRIRYQPDIENMDKKLTKLRIRKEEQKKREIKIQKIVVVSQPWFWSRDIPWLLSRLWLDTGHQILLPAAGTGQWILQHLDHGSMLWQQIRNGQTFHLCSSANVPIHGSKYEMFSKGSNFHQHSQLWTVLKWFYFNVGQKN